MGALRALVDRIARLVGAKRSAEPFPGSREYWERRYAAGGHSGAGSYGIFAEFKADVLNAFVAKHGIRSVMEFGCGDGNQLTLAQYPAYLGFDVSATAIAQCEARFGGDATKAFRLMETYAGDRAELTLSLDVTYHLVEDEVFVGYMRTLFGAADRHVIIYSNDTDDNDATEGGAHVRHRKFTRWIAEELPQWRLAEHIANKYPYKGDYRKGSFADFYVYEKANGVRR